MQTTQPLFKGAWGEGDDATTWEVFLDNQWSNEILESTTAVGVIAFWDHKVALIRNSRHWDITGGHLEEGEDIYDAAHRELMEEGGGTTDQLIKFAYFKIINPPHKLEKPGRKPYPPTSYIPMFCCHANAKPGTPTGIGDDVLDYGLYPLYSPKVNRLKNFMPQLIAIAYHEVYGNN